MLLRPAWDILIQLLILKVLDDYFLFSHYCVM